MSASDREVRFEMLRPAELNVEQKRCPLVFLPVAPLEYHGPHLPVGMDPINATQCALEACRRLGRGVVHPTLYWGTERERPDWMLESLGFKKEDWVVGMDFPTAIWKSHYQPEHLFGLVVAATLEMLIQTGYKLIVMVNGHGAWNQLETLERLARHYSHTTDALVIWKLAFTCGTKEPATRPVRDLPDAVLPTGGFRRAEAGRPVRPPAAPGADPLQGLLDRGRPGLQRQAQPGQGHRHRSAGRHGGEGPPGVRGDREDVRRAGRGGATETDLTSLSILNIERKKEKKMTRRMLIVLLLAGLLLPGMLFAGGGAEGAKGPMKILFIPFTMEHVFQKELCDGAKILIPGLPASR
jgi:hypothetical protein